MFNLKASTVNNKQRRKYYHAISLRRIKYLKTNAYLLSIQNEVPLQIYPSQCTGLRVTGFVGGLAVVLA